MSLTTVIKLGYAIVVVTFILMIWASLAGARELLINTNTKYPSCYFNPLCTCSKTGDDLGIVQCRDVPLFRVPRPINGSKVFVLHLEDNGIRDLEPQFFQATGLYRLAVNKNPLQEIPEGAFLGLERSLWELELHDVKLTTVPSRALRYLHKLRLLDLSGNEISEIQADTWRGFEDSLQTLILADNSISGLPRDGFSGLHMLDTLDLRGNHLTHIDPTVFRDGMARLNKLLLQDNQLTLIPYEEISTLKQLRTLDLSRNIIKQVPPQRELNGIRLSLDTLKLDYNVIRDLYPASFQYFNILNTTTLDGNPLKSVREDAFRQARIRSLSLRDCGLLEISPAAFAGLESSLQSLDLSNNNLTLLPRTLFHQFDSLRYLNFKENKVESITPSESYNGFQSTLYHLDLSGDNSQEIRLQDIKRMRSLRFLSVGAVMHKVLAPEDFAEYGTDLEELRMTGSSLTKLSGNVFQNIRSIKLLDLSDNQIELINRDAFNELSHLTTLKLANGLADSVRDIPSDSFKNLLQLEHLDLSNNQIQTVPDTAFHFLGNLKRLELQDNVIDVFPKGALQGDIHSRLERVVLSLNRLKQIVQHTFVELPALKDITLEDNVLEVIQRRSFMNLDLVKVINLRGNRLNDISDEAFQNLPSLEELDMSFNNLDDFEFSMLDQVGTLASLRVNVSYNRISRLSDSLAAAYNTMIRDSDFTDVDELLSVAGAGDYLSNIKILDMSHNNISYISRSYFRSAELPLTHLYLSHNKLRNVSGEVFGNMRNLQWLDLSHNNIFQIDYDAFRNSNKLQILYLGYNLLLELSPTVFRGLMSLRVVDLQHNRLRTLADQLFPEEGLERLDLSNNELSRIPTSSLSYGASSTLVQLDLSHNAVPAVALADMLQRYRNDEYLERPYSDHDWQQADPHQYLRDNVYHSVKRPNPKVEHQRRQMTPTNTIYKSLSWLDLSCNHLVRIESGSFGALPKLQWLDLSNNPLLTLDRDTGIYKGLERRLVHLGLRNASLNSVPSLPLSALVSLDLSYNNLPSVPPASAANITQLRKLDLSYNDLTAIPIVTNSLTELRWLSLSGNPITSLTTNALLGISAKLDYLDITRLPLNTLEPSAFNKMLALRTLKTSVFTKVQHFNIPTLLEYNAALRNLWIQVEYEDMDLAKEMRGQLPCKLDNITFTGTTLKFLSDSVLRGVHSDSLTLTIYNTSITDLDRALFRGVERLRNLTLDLRHNELRGVDNPSARARPGAGAVYLRDVAVANNPLVCDCGVGWIEMLERKRRQYLCSDDGEHCMSTRADLRLAMCQNGRQLIDVLKNELECGWSAASRLHIHISVYYALGSALATLLYV